VSSTSRAGWVLAPGITLPDWLGGDDLAQRFASTTLSSAALSRNQVPVTWAEDEGVTQPRTVRGAKMPMWEPESDCTPLCAALHAGDVGKLTEGSPQERCQCRGKFVLISAGVANPKQTKVTWRTRDRSRKIQLYPASPSSETRVKELPSQWVRPTPGRREILLSSVIGVCIQPVTVVLSSALLPSPIG